MSSFFPHCGTPQPVPETFCTNCGEVLSRPSTDRQVIPRSPKVQLSSTESPNSLGNKSKRIRPRRVVLMSALVVLVISGLAVWVFSNKSSKVSNSSASSSEVSLTLPQVVSSYESAAPSPDTTVTIGPARYELGQVLPPCSGSWLAFDPSSNTVVLGNEPDRNAYVIDRWRAGRFEVFELACEEASLLVSTGLEEGVVTFVDAQTDLGDDFKRLSPRVFRVGRNAPELRCCYPDVPFEDATVIKLNGDGTFSSKASEVARFDQWNPAKGDCDLYTTPGSYPAASPDGSVPYYGLYVTVCSEGELVKILQQYLVNRGHEINVDGYFGPATLSALNSQAAAEGYDRVDGAFIDSSNTGLITYGIAISSS